MQNKFLLLTIQVISPRKHDQALHLDTEGQYGLMIKLLNKDWGSLGSNLFTTLEVE